jgi:hypothetical protein
MSLGKVESPRREMPLIAGRALDNKETSYNDRDSPHQRDINCRQVYVQHQHGSTRTNVNREEGKLKVLDIELRRQGLALASHCGVGNLETLARVLD